MNNSDRVVQQSVGMRLSMINHLSAHAHEQECSISRVVREAVGIHLNVTVPMLTQTATEMGISLEEVAQAAAETYLVSLAMPPIT